jgi:hypothetical protein
MSKSKTDAVSRCDSDVDDDLDDLITDSLNDIRPSPKTSQFSNLHSQLIKSAAVKEIKLTNSANGTAAWKEGQCMVDSSAMGLRDSLLGKSLY